MIIAFGIALALILVSIVVYMLLSRKLREKYAILWIVIGLVVLVLGIFPQLLEWFTVALGVQVPSNLLFSLAILLLLGVSLHLSWEISQAEDEIRRVAEESAILNAELERLSRRIDQLSMPTPEEPETPANPAA
ncbi:DUF2304 domain-containing protein [Agromyces cerinus]|uniref:DUF2304 domain-containing protein n=1 Tax=Agromyces cerinus subsp. cerinus TaxID=232089 RepID=A0A1N6DI64_9MICO|nr:DUF2304 domain-containing protein [Agromyces cerinus]SIN70448.1 hypothetical protein SAMN05443544_0258 [Agromyces cerinus subsp. cerinus]